MPLGNLTSQFFANVYLNELDQFVKHTLKVKYYLRYVDDFVILHDNKQLLEKYKTEINVFLQQHLDIELHPDKSKIISLDKGVTFLGFRVFYHHLLLKKSNVRMMRRNVDDIIRTYRHGIIDYDTVYDFFEGWLAYAKQANTYTLRKELMAKVDRIFHGELSTEELNKIIKLGNE